MSSAEIYSDFYSILEDTKLVNCKKKSDISSVLLLLKDEYREIINKSFLNTDYEYWWIETYSESTYYRKRFRAIRTFVNLFNFINENTVSNSDATCFSC